MQITFPYPDLGSLDVPEESLHAEEMCRAIDCQLEVEFPSTKE
jgi:hypothetical protein